MKNNFEQFMSFFNDSDNFPANVADFLLKYGNKSDQDHFKTILLLVEQSLMLAAYKFSNHDNNAVEAQTFLKLMRESAERLNKHIAKDTQGVNDTIVNVKSGNSMLNGISLN